MATLTIRNLDDNTKSRLRIRAARHDHSMEEEARSILRDALAEPQGAKEPAGIATRIRSRIEQIGGAELELPERSERPRSAEYLG